MKSSTSPNECAGCEAFENRDCLKSERVKLSDYNPGQKGTVIQVCGHPDFRLRIMEMGFVKGAEVRVVKDAPLTDPVEFVIKGYHVSLRRHEAADILMSEPENGNGHLEGNGNRFRKRLSWRGRKREAL